MEGRAEVGDVGRAGPDRPGWGRSGLVISLVLLLFLAGALYEGRTSVLQAWLFSRVASTFGYVVEEGPSNRIAFPSGGPHDTRLGYPRIPALTERLDSLGFTLTHQARVTPSLLRWMGLGARPIYMDKGPTGLAIHGRAEASLVDQRYPRYAYEDFDSVPELVWRTLVHIESQDMLDAGNPRKNPAVEWDRLALSAFRLALRELGSSEDVPGGSTLATQMEKYRHSPGGITESPREKLRQMLGASLRAYSGGPMTYEHRRRTVTEFLNSVPLAGQVGFGEVSGIGEGLWAWYGTPFEDANALLRPASANGMERLEQARIYRQVLSLLVAQRRPTYYLARPDGHARLAAMTDVYLELLARDGVIPRDLATAAARMRPDAIRSSAPSVRPPGRAAKGLGSVQGELLEITGVRSLYELDRLDMTVGATLDARWNAIADQLLADLVDPAFLARAGFLEDPLLGRSDPAGVTYSVLLLERTDEGNAVRVEADNFPGDMSLAEGSRLELGSTAKLRTLTTYLEVIEEIYRGLEGLGVDSLTTLVGSHGDRLTRWVAVERLRRPDSGLPAILDAALDRMYSASPHERFLTGGTELRFSNFDARFDQATLSVREAFRHSVNLPFIRLMRDIVDYEIERLATAELLSTEPDARRQQVLVRFAEHEGAQYVRRFQRRYRDLSGPEIFATLLAERGLSATQAGWAIRVVAPEAPASVFGDLLRTHGPDPAIPDERVQALYVSTDPAGKALSDLGYLSRLHPLELWVASQRLRTPGVELAELVAGSRAVVVDVYGWLLRTSRQNAQDVRIRTMLEVEAFQEIHERWRRLGYPFGDLAPTLGTAIGSSGDRPVALAELAGIILNDGVSLPTVRVGTLVVGEDTPFETRFRRRPQSGERVLGSEVARALRGALVDVVTEGTGRRAAGSLAGADGNSLAVGGKTGTGDNRRQEHDSRGRLIASHVTGRTASFVFIAGDRHFGVITAYVNGARAADYRFTSALPAQVLRVLGERLGPLTDPTAASDEPPSPFEGDRRVPSRPLRLASMEEEPDADPAVEARTDRIVASREISER